MTTNKTKDGKSEDVKLSVDDYADYFHQCKAVEENLKLEAGVLRERQLDHEFGFKEV